MHQTFANADLCIAGPGAPDTEAGFLHQRPHPTVQPYRMSITAHGKSSAGMYSVSQADPGACSDYGTPRIQQHSPLSKRAWIVQERYLSPRTLYFGTSQLYFECQAESYFEMSYEPVRSMMDPDGAARWHINFTGKADEDLASWYRVVGLYSKRKLTNGGDKLPALSGLASRYAQVSKDKYLAGLWYGDLFAALHWVTATWSDDEGCNSTHPSPSRPPSWSWAACDRTIDHLLHRNVTTSTPDLKVFNATTNSSSLDPFGEVNQGRLLIKGKVKQATVNSRPSPLPDDYWVKHARKAVTWHYIADSEPAARDVAGFYPDDRTGASLKNDSAKFGTIHCLLLGHHVVREPPALDEVIFRQDRHFWTALAVKPLDESLKTFVRVGMIVSDNYSDIETPFVMLMGGREDPAVLEYTKDWWAGAAETFLEIF
ncbi:hypothetical protein LTR10_003463 [Elasticomyces elasticus]|nr:hypothetical protein LTR10_003463 [Elasticomyces elasticus]KAK4969731.1 hypothetical protein LTR42_009003 [Elasticomyces elasticus]